MTSKAATDEEEDGQCEGEAEVEGSSPRSDNIQTKSAHAAVPDVKKFEEGDEETEIERRLPESSSSRCIEAEEALKSINSRQDCQLGITDNQKRENDYGHTTGLNVKGLTDLKGCRSPLEDSNDNDYEDESDCHIDGCENEQSEGSMMSRDICIAASKS